MANREPARDVRMRDIQRHAFGAQTKVKKVKGEKGEPEKEQGESTLEERIRARVAEDVTELFGIKRKKDGTFAPKGQGQVLAPEEGKKLSRKERKAAKRAEKMARKAEKRGKPETDKRMEKMAKKAEKKTGEPGRAVEKPPPKSKDMPVEKVQAAFKGKSRSHEDDAKKDFNAAKREWMSEHDPKALKGKPETVAISGSRGPWHNHYRRDGALHTYNDGEGGLNAREVTTTRRIKGGGIRQVNRTDEDPAPVAKTYPKYNWNTMLYYRDALDTIMQGAPNRVFNMFYKAVKGSSYENNYKTPDKRAVDKFVAFAEKEIARFEAKKTMI